MSLLDSISSSFYEIQETAKSQCAVGNHICEKMEKMLMTAQALSKIAEATTGHGTRMATAGISIVAGLGYISSGSYVKGTVTTAAGLKESINIWRAVNPNNDLSSLLNEANAGVGMVKTLEEANQSSFKLVDTNLDLIRKKIKVMNDRMVKIRAISMEGQKELEKQKKTASSSYQEAQSIFTLAKNEFKNGKESIESANRKFSRALVKFDQLFELAQSTDISDKEKVKSFVQTVKEIHNTCKLAQMLIIQGNRSIDEGINCLNLACEKESEAHERATIVMERAHAKLAIIAAQAQVRREYELKVDETKEELDLIQARSEDVKKLLDEMSNDLTEAKKLNDDKLGMMSICFGVIPGAVAGFNAAGMPGAIAGGLGGGNIIHNREQIMNKVDKMINGSTTFVDTNPCKEELIKVKFSSRPSGWINRFIRKNSQSYTVGVVDLKVGRESISFPFNLNKDYPISKHDLYKLQQILSAKVLSDNITPQECLDLIEELETKFIHRGSQHKPQIGVIANENPYFGDLKRSCGKLAELDRKQAEEAAFDDLFEDCQEVEEIYY